MGDWGFEALWANSLHGKSSRPPWDSITLRGGETGGFVLTGNAFWGGTPKMTTDSGRQVARQIWGP